jgi:hypothetical protein
MLRQQQVPDHVEHEQRLHGIAGETLAAFGEGKIAQTPGVAREFGIVAGPEPPGFRRGFGDGHTVFRQMARTWESSGSEQQAKYSRI